MNRVLSNSTKRIDSKGRVSVPSVFRIVLAELDINDLYWFQDFVFPAISIGSAELLKRFEQQIEQYDSFSLEANQMSLLIHGGGVFLKLDTEGRLIVTDFIREFTGIESEVTFVGRADHFQLWKNETFHAMQAEARNQQRRKSFSAVAVLERCNEEREKQRFITSWL